MSTETIHWSIETSRTVVDSEFQINGADAGKLRFPYLVVLHRSSTSERPSEDGVAWNLLTRVDTKSCRLCVYPHNKTKTAGITILKLATGIVHHESSPINEYLVKKLKVKVTGSQSTTLRRDNRGAVLTRCTFIKSECDQKLTFAELKSITEKKLQHKNRWTVLPCNKC